MLPEQIFYPFTTEPKHFHNKSFTLLQQNQSTFTANLLPFCNRTKALSQQTKRSETTKQKLFNAKTQSSSALKR